MAAFVCGSCTCRLNRSDTIRRKYEAVKEDLEAHKKKMKSWLYGSHTKDRTKTVFGHTHRHSHSHSHAHKMCHVHDSASQSDSSMEKMAVRKQIWR